MKTPANELHSQTSRSADRVHPIEKQISELEQQLADARARVPKHDVPAAVIMQIDELDQKLAQLRALTRELRSAEHAAIETQILEVKQKLADARARRPRHDIPAALVAEMDKLEEELARLRVLLKDV